MNDSSETSTTIDQDWTDQVRAVARFISDHDLPVITLTATPPGWQVEGNHGCHVSVQISAGDYPRWWVAVDQVIDEHAKLIGDDSLHLHIVALVAGVRVNLLYVQRLGLAVA